MIPRYQNWSLAGDARTQRRVVSFLAKQYGDEEQTVMSGTDDYSADASIQYNTLEKKLLLFIALCMEAEADIEQEADNEPFQPENPLPMDDDDESQQPIDEEDFNYWKDDDDDDAAPPPPQQTSSSPPPPPPPPPLGSLKRSRDEEPFSSSKKFKPTYRGVKRQRMRCIIDFHLLISFSFI